MQAKWCPVVQTELSRYTGLPSNILKFYQILNERLPYPIMIYLFNLIFIYYDGYSRIHIVVGLYDELLNHDISVSSNIVLGRFLERLF